MDNSRLLIMVIIISILSLAFSFISTVGASSNNQELSKIGRYQVVMAGDRLAIKVDTVTGDTWKMGGISPMEWSKMSN